MKKDTSKNTIEIFPITTEVELSIPIIRGGISAGFPSPALDHLDESIDLNKYLIKHPAATFLGRVNGDSLKNAGIHHNDILIIDRSLEPTDGCIAVCFIDGEFTVKRLKVEKQKVWLMPENENYPPIEVTENNEFIIWGIVVYVIKKVN